MEADKQADDQLIRKEIIQKIIQMDAPAELQKLKRVVTQSKDTTNHEWIINLNRDKSIWFNNDNSLCYGAQNQCKIVKEYFGFGTISRYYIMPCLEISNFPKDTREIYYDNPTVHWEIPIKFYNKSKDTIKPGKEDDVKIINSKLSSLKFFVRDGETEFCNQQYNDDYEPRVRSGLRGFLKKIMNETVVPKEFKELKDIYVKLENKQREIEKPIEKEQKRQWERARRDAHVISQNYNTGPTIYQGYRDYNAE